MGFEYNVLGKVRFGYELEDILRLKGITDVDSFLNPTMSCVESEFLFDNILKARDLLVKHIELNNIISIVVDCDCDGVTSFAYLFLYLLKIKPDIKIIIYVHEDKIHGLSDKNIFNKILNDESKLVIIPDAGTGDIDECKQLVSRGKDVIVLDHHSIDPKDNPAIIVNNQLSPKVTDKAMTGVGIVYKFCTILDKYYKVNYANDFLDLVALGMIGDRADTFNLQTRYLILEGLSQIRSKIGNKFIQVLVESQSYSMNNKITIDGIGFYICPLINSLIRLGSYEDKILMVEALCNSDKKLIRKVKGKGEVEMSIQEYVLKSCESTNRKQRKLTEESAEILSKEIESTGLNNYPILVCNARDDVDKNSTGLIANRLADKYQRPCLLMRRKGNVCKGSGRGYDKCSILDFQQWCKDTKLISKADGHPNAFGVEISFENTYKLFELLSRMPKLDQLIYHVYNVYDAAILHDQIIKNIAKYNYVWGNTVTPPIFLIKNVICNKYNINLIGAKQNKIEFMYKNIKFSKQTKGSSLASLYKEIINVGDTIKFDIVGKFTLEKDGTAQVLVEDMIFEKSEQEVGFGF